MRNKTSEALSLAPNSDVSKVAPPERTRARDGTGAKRACDV